MERPQIPHKILTQEIAALTAMALLASPIIPGYPAWLIIVCGIALLCCMIYWITCSIKQGTGRYTLVMSLRLIAAVALIGLIYYLFTQRL